MLSLVIVYDLGLVYLFVFLAVVDIFSGKEPFGTLFTAVLFTKIGIDFKMQRGERYTSTF